MEEEGINSGPLHGLWAVTNRELKKWYKEPFIFIISLVQPIIWIGLFGKAMNLGEIFSAGSLNIPGLDLPKQIIDSLSQEVLKSTFGTTNYFSFLAVGMLSFIVLFSAMSSGMTIVWDRRLGFLNKMLTTPLPRGNVIMGKVLSSVIKALVQAVIVLLIAVLLGLTFSAQFSVFSLAITFFALFLLAMGLSSLFIMLAIKSTRWETQMAIMNLLNLPLLFASNAFYPVKFMPYWLKPVVMVNPLTYANNVARAMLIGVTPTASVAFSVLYLVSFAAIFSFVGIFLSWKYISS
ncbi:MAG: ABC transporter permease [Conexivisphaerales archaeon]